jgi:hypothetical protein
LKISVVTLVNNPNMYKENVFNFFTSKGMEVLPRYFPETASKELNKGIISASNEIIVLCHQDIIFPSNWIEILEEQIHLMNDSNFGVIGTYGITYDGQDGIGNITSGNKPLLSGRSLPCQAMSLDEHCLIVRKSSELYFDESLPYFHIYGADLCLAAYKKGTKCYAINAPLRHLHDSAGMGKEFEWSKKWLVDKWEGKSEFKLYRTPSIFPGVKL